MENSLNAIILQGCPYSMALNDLLNNNKILFNKKVITQTEKNKYKTSEISTFPQLYFDNILIGGYDTTKEIYNKINESDNLDKIKDKLKDILNNKFSNKQILRLIKIFLIHNK